MKQKEREAVGGMPHVAVVIPLYNEGEHIGRVIRGVPGWVRTILVVDDASPDDSLAKARDAADERVHFLCHKENQGVGAASWPDCTD